MKYLSAILLILLTGCGGSLSDEKRKNIKEGLEQQKIVRVTDAEITNEALLKGQATFRDLQKVSIDSETINSVERIHGVKIRFLIPGQSDATLIEQELIEAYINDIATGSNSENLQKLWKTSEKKDYDSLLYTRPQIIKRPDGVEELQGIWNVYLARKDVVMQITRKK